MSKNILRSRVWGFSSAISSQLWKLVKISLIQPRNIQALASCFAELYSRLVDYAEHSISNPGLNLPTAVGQSVSQRVNHLLAKIYGGKYACVSYGGTSGTILTLLIAVLPKFHLDRKIILYDSLCHQSVVGGLVFGRWQAVEIKREVKFQHGTSKPLKLNAIQGLVEECGAENVAAIFLVIPTYDGFRSPSEEQKIYLYAKSLGITVITDAAWGSVNFLASRENNRVHSLDCDVLVTSPHKRGMTPSSIGCIVTNDKQIAELWDQALDLGFHSSSLSFVDTMIAEHRLSQILCGEWDFALDRAEEAALIIRERVSEIHPEIYAVAPEHLETEQFDTAHILISTSNMRDLDARLWAKRLSEDFSIDVEKATATTILLLCGSPIHYTQIDNTLNAMRSALEKTLNQSEILKIGD